MRRKPKYYFCKTWLMNCDFFIGWSWKSFEEYCAKEYGIQVSYLGQSGYTTLITSGSRARLIIWLQKKDNVSVLAHECLHGANFILHRAGVKPSFTNDEPVAYLLTELMTAAGYE